MLMEKKKARLNFLKLLACIFPASPGDTVAALHVTRFWPRNK